MRGDSLLPLGGDCLGEFPGGGAILGFEGAVEAGVIPEAADAKHIVGLAALRKQVPGNLKPLFQNILPDTGANLPLELMVDSLNVLIIQILSALASGGAVVASQYLGRRDMACARRSAAQLYCVLGISTAAVMAVVMLFSQLILRVVFGAIEDDVMLFAQTGFWISALSYPFMGVYNAGAALFRAQGNSKISMRASLVMNVINVAGNAALIYGLGMGVLGAALATLAGRVFAAVWVLRQQRPENPLRIGSCADLKPGGSQIRRILGIGIPTGLENGMFQIGKLCVSSLTATLGTAAIAAKAVANSITTLANIPGNTMNLAIIPVVGRSLGAGEKRQARRYSYILMGIAMGGLLVTNIALFFLIPTAAGWFHLSAEASAMCVQVVRWFDVFSIFLWAASFTLPNVLRSGGDTRFTMTVSIVSMWSCRVVLRYVFVLQLHMDLLGVWLGMFLDWVVRSALFSGRFFSGKWMEHNVI